MEIGVIRVPAAFLYENVEDKCISDEVFSGWPVKVHRQCGEFLEIVTHYGYCGWVNCSAVRRISPETYAEWEFWDSGDMFPRNTVLGTGECPLEPAILCKGITDILKEPNVQACILSTLFMGSTVIAMGKPQEGWQKIKTAGGTCGFVPSCSLLRHGNLKKVEISGDSFGFVPSCSLLRHGNLKKVEISKDSLGFVPSCPKCSHENVPSWIPSQQKLPEIMPEGEAQLRSAILNYAKSYLGSQYRWGGKSHAGIDCSGLAFMSYYMCGILIYRDAAIVEGYPVREIPFSQIKPADLLYFPGHVALYLGHGRYIHATGNPASFGCTINSLDDKALDYRKDLAESLVAVGSVFP